MRPGTVVCLGIFIALFAPGAGAVEYFPSEPGPEFQYSYGSVAISNGLGGSIVRVGSDGITKHAFRLDHAGDVYEMFREWDYGSPYGRRFDPDLKYLDFPLTTGKTWSTWSDREEYSELEVLWTVPVEMSAEVLGPAVVSVPAATSVAGSPRATSSAWLGPERATTGPPGAACSITSLMRRSVSFSMPLATLTRMVSGETGCRVTASRMTCDGTA